MSDVLMGTFADCTTGEVVVRPLTEDEVAQYQATVAEHEAEQARIKAEAEVIAEAKASAVAKLAALGLTAEEIAAL